MKKVLILDDGISYFTDPSHIQRVYGRFWDEGIPINLAITPALRGDVPSARDKSQYYAGIAPEKQGIASPFKVSDNQKLCNYLTVMAEQRLVEICMRGYNGTIDEFKSGDDVLLQQKIEEGKSELQSAFTGAEINTFIAPEKTLSKTASRLLTEYDFHIASYQQDTTYEKSALSNSRNLFHYGELIFTDEASAESQLKQALYQLKTLDFIIIRQAYWAFYDSKLQQTNALLPYWETLVSELLKIKPVEIDTFTFI